MAVVEVTSLTTQINEQMNNLYGDNNDNWINSRPRAFRQHKVRILSKALQPYYIMDNEEIGKERATAIESYLFEHVLFKSMDTYIYQIRNLLFNIRNNGHALIDLPPDILAAADYDLMGRGTELVFLRKIQRMKVTNFSRAIRPEDVQDGMHTCGKCKKKKTFSYQLQTRSGDEPMTSFIECVTCGNHWRL